MTATCYDRIKTIGFAQNVTVIARPAIKRIIAGTAIEDVIARAAIKASCKGLQITRTESCGNIYGRQIVAVATKQNVISASAKKPVVTRSTNQLIITANGAR